MLKQVPFVGKSSLSQRIPYWRFHCIDNTKNNTVSKASKFFRPSPRTGTISWMHIVPRRQLTGTDTQLYRYNYYGNDTLCQLMIVLLQVRKKLGEHPKAEDLLKPRTA